MIRFVRQIFAFFKKILKSPLTSRGISVIINKDTVNDFYFTFEGAVSMDENIVLLLDIYGDILPKSQREALDLRYNSDLSLGEIAEEMGGISRQAVNGFIKSGGQRLIELERTLGNAARFREISIAAERAESILDTIASDFGGARSIRLDALRGIILEIRRANA